MTDAITCRQYNPGGHRDHVPCRTPEEVPQRSGLWRAGLHPINMPHIKRCTIEHHIVAWRVVFPHEVQACVQRSIPSFSGGSVKFGGLCSPVPVAANWAASMISRMREGPIATTCCKENRIQGLGSTRLQPSPKKDTQRISSTGLRVKRIKL